MTLAALALAALGALPIRVDGDTGSADRVRQALPRAAAAVEDRVGPVDWTGTAIRVTTAAGEARDSPAPEWAAAWARPASGAIVLRMDRIGAYPHGSLMQVLVHELAHVAVYRRAGGNRLPRWFEEGVAMSIARELGPADAWHLSVALVLGPPIDLARLDELFAGGRSDAQSGYALARSFVAYIEDDDPGASRRILEAVASGVPFERAVERGTGRPLGALLDAWRREAVIVYRWIPIVTSTATLWIAISLLALLAWARKRRRDAERRERWALEEGELTAEDTAGPHGPH